MPDPQIPFAGKLSIVLYFISSPTSFTESIAPLIPPIPNSIFPPSKAGPADVEQATFLSQLPRTFSPLVPISISRLRSELVAIPLAIMQPIVSAPI